MVVPHKNFNTLIFWDTLLYTTLELDSLIFSKSVSSTITNLEQPSLPSESLATHGFIQIIALIDWLIKAHRRNADAAKRGKVSRTSD